MSPALSACLRAFSSGITLKISLSSFAGDGLVSLRTRVISPLAWSQLSNLNGPVPTGCLFAYSLYVNESPLWVTVSALYCLSAVGLSMENDGSVNADGNAPLALLRLRTAVVGSFASQLL